MQVCPGEENKVATYIVNQQVETTVGKFRNGVHGLIDGFLIDDVELDSLGISLVFPRTQPHSFEEDIPPTSHPALSNSVSVWIFLALTNTRQPREYRSRAKAAPREAGSEHPVIKATLRPNLVAMSRTAVTIR